MDKCVFCEIIAGRATASVIYRDDSCIAFMDIMPVNTGHLLVVPIKHATSLADLEELLAAAYSQWHNVSPPRCENLGLELKVSVFSWQTVKSLVKRCFTFICTSCRVLPATGSAIVSRHTMDINRRGRNSTRTRARSRAKSSRPNIQLEPTAAKRLSARSHMLTAPLSQVVALPQTCSDVEHSTFFLVNARLDLKGRSGSESTSIVAWPTRLLPSTKA